MNLNPDEQKRLEWLDKRLGQLGIDVRQSRYHVQMRHYLDLLHNEIAMTERFLKEDGANPSARPAPPAC